LYTDRNAELLRGFPNQPIRNRSLGLYISGGGNKYSNDLHQVAERRGFWMYYEEYLPKMRAALTEAAKVVAAGKLSLPITTT
jgi:hypothetical protein